MRRREQAKTLGAILDVRSTQQSVARLEASRAAQTLQARRDDEANAAERLRRDQEAWVRCVSDPVGGLALADAWASEVNRTAAALRQAAEEVRAAEEEKSLRSEAWRQALARADAVRTLLDAATSQVRRLAEEARLSELADRTSGQGNQS